MMTRLCLLFCLVCVCGIPQGRAAPMTLPGGLPSGPGGADLHILLRDIAQQRVRIIDTQRELVSRPALGPEAGGGGEEEKAAWVLRTLKERGITQVERLDLVGPVKSLESQATVQDVRPNIIARYPGSKGLEKGRTVWVICHLHVATAGDERQWRSSPWKLRVDNGLLYGRGVMDNNQSLTAAMLLMESLARNNLRPPANLGLILHSQNAGMRHILASRPGLIRPGDLVLVPDYGAPDGSEIGIAEKGLLWLKVVFSGTQRHSAEISSARTPLEVGLRFVDAVQGLMREEFAASDPLFADPHSACTATRAYTDHNAGLNSVAGAFTLHFDCRLTPAYTPNILAQSLETLARAHEAESGVGIALEVLLQLSAPPGIAQDHPAVRTVARAVRAQLPQLTQVAPVGINTLTSASLLRQQGHPAVSWAIMDVSLRQAPDEHAHIQDHLHEAAVLARLLYEPPLPEATPTPPAAASSAPAVPAGRRQGE